MMKSESTSFKTKIKANAGMMVHTFDFARQRQQIHLL